MELGDKFNKLEFLEKLRTDSHGRVYSKFKCDCGNVKNIREDCVKSGNTKSCGCYYRSEERIYKKHGMHMTDTYKIWSGMKRRCNDKNGKKAHLYALKGISYDSSWEQFEAFFNDMGERPSGMSLERIDGNKGYSKKNCCWATPKQQASNTVRNRYLVFNGERKTITQWAEHLGIKPNTLLYRIRRHWSLEKALTNN